MTAYRSCCMLVRYGPHIPNLSINLVSFRNLSLKSSQVTNPLHRKQSNTEDQNKKLIYEGKLSNRILYLKSLSVLSSVGLAASYGYVISQKGISIGLAGVGFAFTPFLVSPLVIAWFFKRYITRLYYEPTNDLYTAYHYGWLLSKKSCTFKTDDVIRSDATSMLNTFTVDNKPFFLHDEDLKDVESVDLYKRMVGLDQSNHENKNSSC